MKMWLIYINEYDGSYTSGLKVLGPWKDQLEAEEYAAHVNAKPSYPKIHAWVQEVLLEKP